MTTSDIIGDKTKRFFTIIKNYVDIGNNDINCPTDALVTITSAITNISKIVENIRTSLSNGKSIDFNYLIEIRDDKAYFREIKKQIEVAIDEESEKIKAILKEIDEL